MEPLQPLEKVRSKAGSFIVCTSILLGISLTGKVQAQQTKPDSLAKPDTLVIPIPKADTIPKPRVRPDSTPTPRRIIQQDSLVIPSDTLPKPGARPVRPDSVKTPRRVAQSDSLVIPTDTIPKPANASRPANTAKPLAADSLPVTPPNAQVAADSLPGGRFVKGRVTDEKSGGLPGVGITVKNTKIQTITNTDGSYQLKVPNDQAILVFSFTGYKAQEQPVNRRPLLNVRLVPDVKALNEVVVVGYGTQSKRDLATATSRVAATEIKTAVVNTVDQALQGRVTGVQVTETSGEPGAATVVRIRGNNSLSGNNEPLYVVDGFPMPPYREASANFTGAYSQNGLYGINPNDIESMEVLKDAAATAIYGSRGANGVILITTKTGKRGEGRVELVNRTSFGQISNPIRMMNSRQYAEIMNESYALTNREAPFKDLNAPLTNTDWVKAITQPSFRQDITLGVSGGSPKSSYYISGNYLLERGTIINSDNNRASLRANINTDINDWYTLKGQLSFVRQKSNRAITSARAWPNSGGLLDGLKAPPTIELNYLGFNSSGIPGYSGYYFANPYNELTSKTDVSQNDYSVINLENWFKIVKGLQLVVSLGTNQNLTRRQVFLPPTTAEGYASKGSGSSSMANTYSYNVNAYFLYEKNFAEKHYLNTTLGGEYNNQSFEQLNTISSGYAIPAFGVDNIGSAQNQSIGSFKETRTLQSAFVRVNYSFKSKYVLNTSLRLDGASPFAENKKYGLFPAVALAWNLNEEAFMKNVKFVSNAKFRVSYGETGSQAIGPYSSLTQFYSGFYQYGQEGAIGTSLYSTTIGNPNLSWERTRQLNAGLDFNSANDRFVFSFDFYNKRTLGLLQPRTLPSQSGVSTILDNYGSMENRGVEVSVQANIIQKKNLVWSSRLNVSRNINTLLDLGERKTPDYVNISGNLLGGTSGILIPGQQVGQFYGLRVIGLAQPSDFTNEGTPQYPYAILSDQIPGTWKYQDLNNDGKIDANDRQVIGKSNPDFIFGWTNDFTWKNLSVTAFFTGSVGNDVLNLTRFYLNNGLLDYQGVIFNQTEDWYFNRWTADRPHNNVRYPSTQRGISSSDINSAILEDGSFVRLKMLTISYGFPKIGPVKNPRLFVTGTNLFTLTKYTGFDPEVSSFNQSLLQQGIDYGAYPAQKSFTIGLSCNF
ncbi:SusC/RagA family TonB-linked outer membrane protein [Siphonobacter curvatus]|uniref:SusC/RagA family TonB-linked outer membrane protein n=1 Tax=Siphonobacter curvatus TaxID=2094562 RepID=A0A2S7IQF5_9BACT|nr:TonB-dependent receptor [Siphonobacter curvatus]PQA59906.1 SusC/RagA family TonB-linked outer membrane protein [Siphonobacter curvatus]